MEVLKAMLVVTSIGVAVLCVAYWIIARIIDAGYKQDHDPDIVITHQGSNFGYYFHDPYGTMIGEGGFVTESGARRAGQQHRDRVGKELEEAMGL